MRAEKAHASLHTRTFVDGQFDVSVDHIFNRGSALELAIKRQFYPLGILSQMWYLIVSIPDPQGGGGGGGVL